jgi:hypothetical protein
MLRGHAMMAVRRTHLLKQLIQPLGSSIAVDEYRASIKLQ